MAPPSSELETDNSKATIDHKSMVSKSTRRPCPEAKANPISRLFLGWVFSIVYNGFRKPLQDEDLWELRDHERGSFTSKTLIATWNEISSDTKQRKPGNTLFVSILRIERLTLIFSGFLKAFDVLLLTIQPILIFNILRSLEEQEPLRVSMGWAASLLFVPLLKTTTENHYFLTVMRTGMRVRSGLQGTIYDKSLKMSPTARASSSLGEIVNLMQLDTQRIGDFYQYVHNLWAAPIQIIITVGLLFNFIGISAIIGLVVTLATLPAQTWLMSALIKLRTANIGNTDKRVKLMNEILQGIKAVKFYAWEKPFSQEVDKIREQELDKFKGTIWLRSGFMAIMMAIPIIIAVITFSFFAGVFNQELNPARIFTGLALLNQLRLPVMMLPMTANSLIDARIGLKRIERFLNLENTSNHSKSANQTKKSKENHESSGVLAESTRSSEEEENGSIIVTDGEFDWGEIPQKTEDRKRDAKVSLLRKCLPNKKQSNPSASASNEEGPSGDEATSGPQRSTLRDMNLSLRGASLNALVGRVGSGKSSLIHAILGEMRKLKGDVQQSGSIAYVAQTAWIFNDTLRNNILFGKEFDENLYKTALKVSALERDIDILPGGDLTAIGEKGINLSGGQKQRVSIARAVYADAQVYLFDDPLSALDAHVSGEVFEQCISNNGVLKDRLRLLITNQAHVLPECDNIIYLDSGMIKGQGTFADLSASDASFQQLINEQQDESESENDDEDWNAEEGTHEGSRHQSKSISVSRHTKTGEQQTKSEEENDVGKSLMQKEERITGNVLARAYYEYARACGGPAMFTFMFVFWCFSVALSVIANWWLAYWSEKAESGDDRLSFYLGIYFMLAITYAGAVMVRGVWFLTLALVASRRLHDSMLKSVLHAPMSFFDTTPIGRIISRFSRDMQNLDELLPQFFQQMMSTLLNLIASYIYIGVVLPLFFAVAGPVTIGYFLLQRFFNRTSVELKRLDAISKSPIYAHFSETLGGLTTIRAYGKEDESREENVKMIDINQRAYFTWVAANRWFSLYLEFAGSSLIFATALFGVLAVRDNGAFDGNIGLSLTYALQVTGILGFSVRSITELEGQMSSVERANYYSNNISQEAAVEVDFHDGEGPAADWPAEGEIEFDDIQMRYREELDLVLRGVSLKINPGERVGVVGRTGSGKSSLMIALLRIVELAGGNIKVDGVNLRKLGLNDVRKNITIIPQDPTLFSGTIRFNLDPFGEYTDAVLWDALEKSHMKEFVSEFEGGLDAVVSEYGENLSAGQRQIICFTRALLRNSKVLILDEASSSLDNETDRMIQESIRIHLKDSTILTIAHRLFTLVDYDRIIVMDNGKVAEFASPLDLLNRRGGLFSSLVEAMGPGPAQRFRDLAAANMQTR